VQAAPDKLATYLNKENGRDIQGLWFFSQNSGSVETKALNRPGFAGGCLV